MLSAYVGQIFHCISYFPSRMREACVSVICGVTLLPNQESTRVACTERKVAKERLVPLAGSVT